MPNKIRAINQHWVSTIAVFAVLAAFNSPVVVPVSNRQAGGWLEPVALSPQTQSSWFPDVAVDDAGIVHAVWSTSVSTGVGQAYDVVMYAAKEPGAAWRDAKDLIALPSKGAVTRPTLLADAQGLLHLTFRSYTVFYSHAPIQSVVPAALLQPRAISSVDNGYFSRLGIDKQGRLHLVYTENLQSPSCVGCFHVFYRQSGDQGSTWSPAVDISRLSAGAAKPQLLIDVAGNLHVVWEAGLGGDLGQLAATSPTSVMYTASYDGGQSWSSPFELASFPVVAPTAAPIVSTPLGTEPRISPTEPKATPTVPPASQTASPAPSATPAPKSFKNIALGQDGHGNLVVGWLEVPDDHIYFQVSRDLGRSWSDPQIIPGVVGAWSIYQGRTDDYAMATDAAGVTHLAVVGRTNAKDATLSVLHLSWDGSTWTKPEAVVTLTGAVPEWPRLAVGLGNDLQVVWFVRDQAHIFGGEGASQYRVWYSHQLLAAPSLTPVVWPTLAPIIAASSTPDLAHTATQSLSPTPATPATSNLRTPSNPNLVYNELDYLKVVAIGLIPALVVILLIIGLVLLLRR